MVKKKQYTFIDLFAGCGGLSEGFMESGHFRGLAHVEWELPMVQTLRNRLVKKWNETLEQAQKRVVFFDIQRTDELLYGNWSQESIKLYAKNNSEEAQKGLKFMLNGETVDLIIGGPPCQAYSIHGRATDKNSMQDDYRNYLFESFVKVVDEIKPKAFIFENVTGMLSARPGGKPVVERIYQAVTDIGYTILSPNKFKEAVYNAYDFSVPQNRERVILCGVKNDSGFSIESFYNALSNNKDSKHYTVRDAIGNLIGEATAYDKKLQLEVKRPKSWLKSVSAFANGEGGTLVFGISDDDQVVGLADAETDAERISEEIKTKLDPIPTVNLEFKEVDGKKLVLLHVYKGQETPYYYIGDKQRLAFVRVGNESVVADRLQLKNLVMRGAGRSFDAIPSPYKFEDMAFSKLKSVHFKRLNQSFDDSDFVSWGIVDNDGKLTNAGALLADDSPIRHSRIFCTRWNGLDMTSGLGEALDDAELEGSVIGQLQDAVAFVRNNSHRRWWKEADYREELPDYPERAVTEVICNAIIHRDYMELGSEIHIDMYDDRMEVYSPGGMFDGRLIQQLNPMTVPSKRRNPLLADFFHRLKLMERRGSGMKKIIGEYKRFENLENYHAPEFNSNASEFHVTLWNLNYGMDVIKDNPHVVKATEDVIKDVVKETGDVVKAKANVTKEFVKAQRQIYKLISQTPQINATQMSENMGISLRQVQRYLKQLSDLNLIVREGGRKNGIWKILDEEYEGFFKRI